MEIIDLRTMAPDTSRANGKSISIRTRLYVNMTSRTMIGKDRYRLFRHVATLGQSPKEIYDSAKIYTILLLQSETSVSRSESQYHSFSINPHVRRDLYRCIDINHGRKCATVDLRSLWLQKDSAYSFVRVRTRLPISFSLLSWTSDRRFPDNPN